MSPPESAASHPAQHPGRRRTVAVIGNPNTGKSTAFNSLTGLRHKVGNYPGVTVEKHVGIATLEGVELELIDLPGAYSLSAGSPDEMVAVDVLLGRMAGVASPDVVLLVLDASNLRRNLYLATQVLELGLPTVVAVNMADVAASRGVEIDFDRLGEILGVPVVELVASKGKGMAELRRALVEVADGGEGGARPAFPALKEAAVRIAEEARFETGLRVEPYEVERALLDQGQIAEERLREQLGDQLAARLDEVRDELAGDEPLTAVEADRRYGLIGDILAEVERHGDSDNDWTDRIDKVMSHPVVGTAIFVLVMAAVFQSVFTLAIPVMDGIDAAITAVGDSLVAALPPGALRSLLVDGVVAGVGSVVVFVPQIVILFSFIIILEDTGYMARAAFLMDRTMRWCGLSGQSFIPMLSSFACAVPGIMATRVIPDRRDRLATILAAPFMTCSARLPVYALLIAAFVPRRTWLGGVVNLQGIVLLALYLLGIVAGIATAFLLKRTVLRGRTATFLLELPPYRVPHLRTALLKLWARVWAFLVRAGSVIFLVTVIVWGLAYFPHPNEIGERYDALRAEVRSSAGVGDVDRELRELTNRESAAYLEASVLGRAGHLIEPVFEPLGWDWKVSSAVLASFPAREIVIAVLGTTYALGSDVSEEDAGLVHALRSATWPDGRPIFTLPMVLGLLIFFALCLQCAGTVATIYRETNSWQWPALAWTYMTVLAYVGALLTYQIGSRL